MPDRVMASTVALVMMNKCVFFEDCSFSNIEVMTKVKVFHDDDADTAADTWVITIPRLFFFYKKQPS